MPLFEVAIIEKPTKKQKESGEEGKLLFGPKAMMASDYKTANMKALQSVKDLSKLKPSLVEVLIRPFVSS